MKIIGQIFRCHWNKQNLIVRWQTKKSDSGKWTKWFLILVSNVLLIVILKRIDYEIMESTIKWKTGKPKESGTYIVTLRFGLIEEDSWNNIIQRWTRNNGIQMRATNEVALVV